MSDDIVVSFGTTNLSGKGLGSYSGGVVKLWKEYSDDLYISACQFHAAAKLCLNGNVIEEKIPIYLVPGVVCAAFACELALKWLIHRATGSEVKGHFLNELFDKLGDIDKAAIKAATRNLDQFLSNNKNLFVDARYHHEKSIFAFREQEILQFSDFLMSYIESLHHNAPS